MYRIIIEKTSLFIKSIPIKNRIYFLFLFIITITFIFSSNLFNTNAFIEKEALAINDINYKIDDLKKELDPNKSIQDSIHMIEEKILYSEINEKLVKFLFKSRNYNDLSVLKKYFKYSPVLLNEIPSIVPLEKGNYVLSSSYGHRFHPIHKKNKKHYGIDLAADKDKKVYSTADGVVISVKRDLDGYGKHIIIKHRFGFSSLYAHLNKTLVRKNQKIKQYTLIGTVGSSGSSTGNHLHYEVIKNKKKINPYKSFNLKKDVLTK